ncbi:MAG: glycosyltransferase family 2 protein [Anaerolineae bacterium]|nr:glycosyltransferase family 2 protein [Anaerolineae bacterium]
MVIPVHNEEKRLPAALQKIDDFLAGQSYTAEVVVVENGSADKTIEVAERFAAEHPYVRVFVEDARGKGLAVRRGMIEARGQYRFMADVDFSMPVEEIGHFLPPKLEGYDVAIGSREAPGAVRYDEPLRRHLMGRVLNLLVKLLAIPDFEDTQCGFKCFTAHTAEDIFPLQRMNGIGFDVEALFIAKRRGYKVVEVPINWYYDADSRMKLMKDSLAIIREIFEIRRNWRDGVYKQR